MRIDFKVILVEINRIGKTARNICFLAPTVNGEMILIHSLLKFV